MARKRTPVVTGIPAKGVPVGNVVSATVNGLNGFCIGTLMPTGLKRITVRLLKWIRVKRSGRQWLHQKMSGYI